MSLLKPMSKEDIDTIKTETLQRIESKIKNIASDVISKFTGMLVTEHIKKDINQQIQSAIWSDQDLLDDMTSIQQTININYMMEYTNNHKVGVSLEVKG